MYFILHWFYLRSEIALTGYIFDQNIAFLVPDSCWAIERNGNSISTDDAFENVQNNACFSYFQIIWQLFWNFDIAG
jgi:hypothetical protein